MTISKLLIRSFKSIVDQSLDLGWVNAFIGANGSGKSNILEAIGVISAAASGRVDDESLRHRGVRPGIPRLYKSAFADVAIAPHIYFEAHGSEASYSVTLNNPLENPRPAWQYKSEELSSRGETIVSRGPRTARNKEAGLAALHAVSLEERNPAKRLFDVLREFAVFSPMTHTLRGLAPDPQTREPIGLAGGRLAEAFEDVQAFLRTSPSKLESWEEFLGLIDWLSGIESVTNAGGLMSASVPRPQRVIRFTDRFMRKGKNSLSAYDASEGALYVLFLAVLALHPKTPACLAIDNIDQALNPRLVRACMQLFCRCLLASDSPRQILFTLHNPSALDGLLLTDNRVRLFSVDRNSFGHSVVQRVFITPELRQLPEKDGWPLSKLWVMGHLGGVPNV